MISFSASSETFKAAKHCYLPKVVFLGPSLSLTVDEHHSIASDGGGGSSGELIANRLTMYTSYDNHHEMGRICQDS